TATADGTYSFNGIATGEIKIRVDSTGNSQTTFYPNSEVIKNGITLNIQADQNTTNINITMQTINLITGNVQDANGNPIIMAKIEVFYGSWNYQAVTTTNVSGDYTIWVPSGSYKVRASTGNYVARLYGATVASPWAIGTTVNVARTFTTGGINFQLAMGGGLAGLVQDISGNVLSGAKLEILSTTGNYIVETVSSADGRYVFAGIPTGQIKIRVSTLNITRYYNNALNINNAAVLTITANQDLSSVNFQLRLNAVQTTLQISITTPSSLIVEDRVFYLEGTVSYLFIPTINVFNVSSGKVIDTVLNGSSWIVSPSIYLSTGNNQLLVYAEDVSGNVSTASITVKLVQRTISMADTVLGVTVSAEAEMGAYPTNSVLSITAISTSNITASAGIAPTGTNFVLGLDITVSPSITSLNAPLNISVLLPAGISTSKISVLYWSNLAGAWSSTGISNVSVNGRSLYFTTTHLSNFAVLSGALNSRAPTIDLIPVYEAIAGEALTINVTVSDEASVNLVQLLYQDSTSNSVVSINMISLSNNVYSAVIPASALTNTANISYWILATDGTYSSRTATFNLRIKTLTSAGSAISELVNYPNPFAAAGTTFYYVLSNQADVVIEVYTIRGEKIRTLRAAAGSEGGKRGVNRIAWSGQNDFAEDLANGVYLYIVKVKDASGSESVKKGKCAVLR
ncbi:MAG: carboxypeptidase regulatory-like domain-containing protein, partial [Candidatus Margulisiibacteriota bacterium]